MKEFEIKENTKITCNLRCTVTTEVIGKTLVTLFEPNIAEFEKPDIIEEPFYINEHGTEFFKGDEYWFVCKSTRGMANSVMSDRKDPHGNDNYSFPMTERECHQYLADNWDKLKK